jgi:hypothetical protein
MVQCWKISLGTLNTHHQDTEMITSETPYKLAEIIRDTWPNLYTFRQLEYNKENYQKDEQV